MYYGVPNYDPENVAPLIEQFAAGLGLSATRLNFRYKDRSGTYFDVAHPGDKNYSERWNDQPMTAEMETYLQYAQKSERLREFATANKITYFLPFYDYKTKR